MVFSLVDGSLAVALPTDSIRFWLLLMFVEAISCLFDSSYVFLFIFIDLAEIAAKFTLSSKAEFLVPQQNLL